MLTYLRKSEAKRRVVNEAYDTAPSLHHRFNYKIAKPYLKNKRVLDIGCWSGQFEKLAICDAKEIIGIDPGAEAIRFAKKNVPRAKFRVGDALALKFPRASFDTVVFLEVLEHLPKGTERAALKQIYTVLKPGGHLILSTPNHHPLSVIFDPAYFLLGHRHYSEKWLIAQLQNAGFTVLQTYKTGGINRLAAMNLEMLYKHLFFRQFATSQKFQKRIAKEYASGGFVGNHIIAQAL